MWSAASFVCVQTDAVPADMSVEPGLVFLDAEPDKHRPADDVVLGHEAPVAAVGGVVAVVAHHPVVIHLERVGVADAGVLVFVGVDHAAVDGIVVLRQQDPVTLAGNINGPVIVARPVDERVALMMDGAERIDLAAAVSGLDDDGVYLAGAQQLLFHLQGQREMVHGLLGAESEAHQFVGHAGHLRIQVAAVILGDTDFLEQRGGKHRAVGLDEVVVLHAFVVGQFCAVDINLIVNNLQRVSRPAHAAFHVVLAAVHRARDDVAEHILALTEGRLAVVVTERVVVGVLHERAHGVAGREIEDHDVSALGVVPSGHTAVRPLRFVQVTLAAAEPLGEGVLYQRETERRIGDTRTVTGFAHEEEITHAEALLQRGGGDLVVLEQVEVDEIDGHQCEDDGVYPGADGVQQAVLVFQAFPPGPGDVVGDEHVRNQGQKQQPPEALPVSDGDP